MAISNSYVSLPEGTNIYIYLCLKCTYSSNMKEHGHVLLSTCADPRGGRGNTGWGKSLRKMGCFIYSDITGKWWLMGFYSDSMEYEWNLPSCNLIVCHWTWSIEVVDLPNLKWWFSIAMLNYQRVLFSWLVVWNHGILFLSICWE